MDEEQKLQMENNEEDEEGPEEEFETSAIFSPEGIIMLSAALLFDGGEFLVDLLCLIIGWIPYVGQVLALIAQAGGIIWDVIAFIFFGLWMLIRFGSAAPAKQKLASRASKAAKWGKRLTWIRPLCVILEFIPVVDNVPGWTFLVWTELKSKKT